MFGGTSASLTDLLFKIGSPLTLSFSFIPADAQQSLMSASDLFTQANEAFFDDDYDEALSLYTEAIKLEPENPEFYLKR